MKPLLATSLALALTLARSCGFTPDDPKGEGEPCTRTTECDVLLECRGGVCMRDLPDGGGMDAAVPSDASVPDASGPDASPPSDAATTDAEALDATAVGDAG